MIDRNRLLMIVGVVAVILVVLCLCVCKSKKESFANIGGIDNIGSIDGYAKVEASENMSPSSNYADLANAGTLCDDESQRMQRVASGKLLPRISTPYNIDLADPVAHRYMVNGPRVVTALQSRYKDYSLRSFIAGDIPIKYHPDIPLVEKTHLTRDDLRYDAVFSPHAHSMYNNYTHGFKNTPMMLAGMSAAGAGHGGASSALIMDAY